jgi:DNA-binding CsgD family transcriptional regulator
MDIKLTARNRQILEALTETPALLGVNYPSVCTTRGILKLQGLDTTTQAGREKCQQWLADNPAPTAEYTPLTANQIEIAKHYAHGVSLRKIAHFLKLKTHTVEMYFSRMAHELDFPHGEDRRLLLREWLVEKNYYPPGHDFTAQTITTEEAK